MDEYLHVITTKTHIQVMKANQVHLYVLFNIDTLFFNGIIFVMNDIFFIFQEQCVLPQSTKFERAEEIGK